MAHTKATPTYKTTVLIMRYPENMSLRLPAIKEYFLEKMQLQNNGPVTERKYNALTLALF